MTYTIQTDIAYTATKSEIKELASEYNCILSQFQQNGPGGGNHLCDFTSNSFNSIQKLCDELSYPHKKIEKK